MIDWNKHFKRRIRFGKRRLTNLRAFMGILKNKVEEKEKEKADSILKEI